MLELRDINAFYGPVRALRNILLRIEAGNIVSVSGPPGAGKSTLLGVVSGIVRSSGGTIRFQDRDITCSSTVEIVRLGISLVPEGGQLFKDLSVLDNLLLGAYFYNNRKFKPDIKERLAWVHRIFPPLPRLSDRLAGTLGRKEQQMTAIGRALMARPKLLLLDEPCRGLPPAAAREIFQTVCRLNDHGITILLAEGNLGEAPELAHYGYRLADGVVVREGALRDRPARGEKNRTASDLGDRPGPADAEASEFHEP